VEDDGGLDDLEERGDGCPMRLEFPAEGPVTDLIRGLIEVAFIDAAGNLEIRAVAVGLSWRMMG
jgi:hypothetical protein